MAIKQLTAFVQNKKGALVSVTDALAKNGVNLRALSIAETEDLGILRLIVNENDVAEYGEVILQLNDYKILLKKFIELLLKAENTSYSSGIKIYGEKTHNIEGNIMSLISKNFETLNTIPYNNCFKRMFANTQPIKRPGIA